MKLILKLNPKTSITRFHELERYLRMDFKDAVEDMHLEGDETEPN